MTDHDPTEEKRAWLRELLARSEPGVGDGIFARKPNPTTNNNNNRSTK